MRTRSGIELVTPTVDYWNQANYLHAKTTFGSYQLPDPRKTVFNGAVINPDNDSVIAYGSIPLLAEAVIVVDDSCSTRRLMESISLLLEAGKSKTRGKLDGIHAFIQDPEFSKLLQKHFGFRKCKGEALYLDND